MHKDKYYLGESNECWTQTKRPKFLPHLYKTLILGSINLPNFNFEILFQPLLKIGPISEIK